MLIVMSASYGYSPEFDEYHADSIHVVRWARTRVGRTVLEGKPVHIPDVLADPEYQFMEECRRSERLSHHARRSAAARR